MNPNLKRLIEREVELVDDSFDYELDVDSLLKEIENEEEVIE